METEKSPQEKPASIVLEVQNMVQRARVETTIEVKGEE